MERAAYHRPGPSAASLDRITNLDRENEEHLTVPHKVMSWPAVNHELHARGSQFTQDLHEICSRGSSWFVEKSKWTSPATMSSGRQDQSAKLNSPMPAKISNLYSLHRYGEVAIKGYVEAYFRTFNKSRPILNQAFFMREVELQLTPATSSSREIEGVLLLLVIALGQVAYEGTAGVPIESFAKRSSGIRGGTASSSPGTSCFDEAIRRWDLTPITPTLLNIHALILQATFYEASARHWDFWRCAVAASSACEQLIKERNVDWSTLAGEMLKRAYWACVLDEGYFHHDLDLPGTGVFALQDEVPLPSFVRDTDEPISVGAEAADSPKAYLHFLASTSLKRLVDRIHDAVHESM
jgi:hypothetical protein